MKIVFSFLLLMVSLPLAAGSETSIYNYGDIEKGETCLFGDSVRIRKTPEIKEDNVLGTLPAGYAVTVEKKTGNVMALNGFSSYWYRVSYKNNGRSESGFVWGGLLAIGCIKKENDFFLLGIKSFSRENGFEGECRILSGGKIVSALPVKLHYLPDGNISPFYGYSVSLSLNGGMGLSGLDNVVDIYCHYDACGYPGGHIWVGIAGKKMYFLGSDSSVSEAGVFHYEERIIFPSEDKSLKDELRLVSESFDFDEKIKDYRLSDRKEKRFIWKNSKIEERR